MIPIGLIGTDEIGKLILEKMKNKRLLTAYIKRIGGNSGKAKIILDNMGEREIIREKSVNSLLHEHIQEILSPLIRKNPIVHIKSDLKVAGKILDLTESIFSADISGFLKMGKEEIKEMPIKKRFQNRSTKVLLGNLQEYIKLMDTIQIYDKYEENIKLEYLTEYFNSLKEIFNAEWIFVKQGSKGASVLYNNEFIHFPAPIVNVVDTTGAGDAFNAGVIYGLLNNIISPREILELAIIAGSLNCTALGGQEFSDFAGLKNNIENIKKKYFRNKEIRAP